MSKRFSTLSQLLNAVLLLNGTADPTAGAGVPAAIGSKYWRGTGTAGDFTKTSAPDTGWTGIAVGIYFNVKDPAYGAAGDGVTDDRAAIQLAIDDCASAGGGTVFFPPGTYLCGKSGANPYAFLINVDNVRFLGTGWGGSVLKQSGDAGAGAYSLITIDGGSDSTEFELLTLDQSGLSNPGADQCSMINAVEATILKFINCKFQGGVANAGAYIKTGGTIGSTCEIIWVDGCDLRDAGGPLIWMDSETQKMWIVDSTLVQTNGEVETIYAVDTVATAAGDIKIFGNHIENEEGRAINVAFGTATLTRLQVVNNICIGAIRIAGVEAGQVQQTYAFCDDAGYTSPILEISDVSSFQVQQCIIARTANAGDGLVVEVALSDTVQVQDNHWWQERVGQGVVRYVDTSELQSQDNMVHATDADSGADCYVVEADTVDIDNIQLSGDMISADLGLWDNAIHILSSGQNIGIVQVTPGIIDDCDVGVFFDENGGGAAVFTSFLMVAGGVIEADTAAWTTSVGGIYVRIGANASTFQPQYIAGNGDPENNVTARIGSMYVRMDGGLLSTLYIKQSGTGNTGWIAK